MATETNIVPQSTSAPSPRIRIVHIQLLPILSGVQRVSLEELEQLDPDVFERHLICQSPGEFTSEAARIGVQCHFADQLRREIDPLRDCGAYRQIKTLLRAIDPHIVHTHSSKTGLLGRYAATSVGVPVVLHTVHGFAFPATGNSWKKRVFQACEVRAGRKCDTIICLNRADEITTKSVLRVPPENVVRISNGICLDRFSAITDPKRRTAIKKELLGLDDRPLVINVGRLWEQKNPELFVRAACQLVSEGLQCNFALAGDGPLREKLAGIIRDAGAAERVHLLGWREDVSEFLPAADLFVLSSNWEGMPLVLLEANACGVPAIATDVPGSQDCILDGVTGHLAIPNDQQDLVAKIRQLISDPVVRAEMSIRCREHVREFHDIRDRHEAICRLYAVLLDRAGRESLADLLSPRRHRNSSAKPTSSR